MRTKISTVLFVKFAISNLHLLNLQLDKRGLLFFLVIARGGLFAFCGSPIAALA